MMKISLKPFSNLKAKVDWGWGISFGSESWDETFNLEDVGFQLQKYGGILTTLNIGIYLKPPLNTFSYLSFIHFRHPPHHPVLQGNLPQSECTYCKVYEQMGE